jgi:hypothetical protein
MNVLALRWHNMFRSAYDHHQVHLYNTRVLQFIGSCLLTCNLWFRLWPAIAIRIQIKIKIEIKLAPVVAAVFL